MAAVCDDYEVVGIVPNALCRQSDLFESMSEEENAGIKKTRVKSFIRDITENDECKVPDFGTDLEWLNTSQPLSLYKDLYDKVVILDFFTYCCINCMHILPHLKRLEIAYPPSAGLVIIGIHSAKFQNEKYLKGIMEAVMKYDIEHPVVSDPEAKVWNSFQVQCWPTLLILGPRGHLLFALVGETNIIDLAFLSEIVLEYFSEKKSLSTTSLPLKLLKDFAPSCILKFPGKVCTDSTGEYFAVSDSGHNRIIVIARNGFVKEIIGNGCQGFSDGLFKEASFNSPQGIEWRDNGLIYVADTGNHAIRLINMKQMTVKTICGNGTQGNDKVGGQMENNQTLNSPWDLCIGPSIGSVSSKDDVLYIAMAGNHQIWALFVEDTTWLKGRICKRGVCLKFAGSGAEENRNNSYPHCAGFAQPSGITFSKVGDHHFLFVADSESSTIRCISLKDGSVKTAVGGSTDPQNLFAFGDVDGTGVAAKLQHPLGVAACSSGVIYIADSYNHKIKVLNLITNECTTFCGNGTAGNNVSSIPADVEFNEPGGLCITDNGKTLVVADTNNHCLKMIDVIRKEVYKFPILHIPEGNSVLLDELDNSPQIKSRQGGAQNHSIIKMQFGGTVKFVFNIQLSDDLTLTEGAPQQWQASIRGGKNLSIDGNEFGYCSSLNKQLCFNVKHNGSKYDSFSTFIDLSIEMYLCRKSNNTCFPRNFAYDIPLDFGFDGCNYQEVEIPIYVS